MGQEETCCFTGHRPGKLPWGEDEWDSRCVALKDRLAQEIERAYELGMRHFICGMAQGADFYFCEEVLRFRETHPDVRLEAAIPCPEQAGGWPAAQQERWKRLVVQCDLETLVQPAYTPGCMARRNRYMVRRSAMLIAVYNGQPGGTRQTLAYAMREGLQVVQIDPECPERV